MAGERSAGFYRGRADDMRRQADRALGPHLRETYLRIAGEWQRMAEQAEAADAKIESSDDVGPHA